MNERAEHMPALDGLRALAILLVIPHNADVFSAAHGWIWPFAVVAHTGWIGVQLFFVLSGFLITGNLLASRGAENYYSAFFGRRILRIFPLYFLVLFVFLVALPIATTLSPSILATYDQQLPLWLFVSNWTQPFYETVHWFPHFWSLAVEEQFYLVWPFAIVFIPARRLLAFCIGVAAVAMVCRCVMLAYNTDPQVMYMFTICRMDALALGAAAAVVVRRPGFALKLRANLSRVLAAGFACLVAGALATRVYDTHSAVTITVGYTALAAGMTALVMAASDSLSSGASAIWRRILSLPVLRSIGRYSYAMYVFHLLIVLLLGSRLLPMLKPLGDLQPVAYVVAVMLLSYCAGWISYYGFERYFLRLKVHFQPRCDATHVSSSAH